MKLENIEVGRYYRAVASPDHCFYNGEIIKVTCKYEDWREEDLVEAESVDAGFDNMGVCQTLRMNELTEQSDRKEKMEEFKSLFQELILGDEIEIQPTSYGSIQILIDGEVVIES